jgi:hypothetical protein
MASFQHYVATPECFVPVVMEAMGAVVIVAVD